jgi:3-oxosteroid 1-dehydrogenase
VIPGLYATCVSTASVMGRAFPGAGASVGPSFTWGFIAAKHALGAEAAGAKPSRAKAGAT